MADFVSGFWNIYVMGLVTLSLLFCVFVLASNMKGEKNEDGEAELHGHVWDETLCEYNNPLPRWWMYLFWITIFFAIAYMVVFPGFGNNQGLFGWSSAIGENSQYAREMRDAEKKYGPIFAKYQDQDLKAVAADPEAQGMGQRMFLTYCAQCHGSDARGARGFPNLTDSDWLYGGDPEVIKATILDGRQAAMPALGAAVGGDEGVKDLANYVRSLSGLSHDAVRAEKGRERFAVCAGCHGVDGTGNQAIGAPNLTDQVWLYGSSEAKISEAINNGRNGRMPAFREFLGEAKVHILSAYVYGLSAK